MSGGCELLKPQEEDVTRMLAATTHLGSENSETNMEQYVFKRRSDGVNVINISDTWEKLIFAARVLTAIENPAEIFVISSRSYGQRAVLKFARYVGATPIAGRFTPGTFTNHIQAAFREPRILIVADPRADHQPVTEASYSNIPVIAFSNVDSPTKNIDICIPCNNKSVHSIGLMFYFLAREVLRMKGAISRDKPWDVMPDLFFYRDPEEAENEEQARLGIAAMAGATAQQGATRPQGDAVGEEIWEAGGTTEDWHASQQPGEQAAPAMQMNQGQSYTVSSDWANQQQKPVSTVGQPAAPSGTGDWSAAADDDNWG